MQPASLQYGKWWYNNPSGLNYKAKEAVSQVKSETAFFQFNHVALLPNGPFHPERSIGTEAEGGKNSQSVFNAGPCPGSFATIGMTRVMMVVFKMERC